jgi:predicted secreted protein
VGDEVEVTLPETATTGYVWHPEVDESILRPAGEDRKVPTDPRGAPGMRVIAFEAVRAGETSLRLIKRRSWEAEAKDEFSVKLEVERA